MHIFLVPHFLSPRIVSVPLAEFRTDLDEQKKWQTMDNTIWVLERVELDGVMFRSASSQTNCKTDNSVVLGWTETQREGGELRKEKVYGRVSRFILHFMYPPTPEQLGRATTKSRIDPKEVGVEWNVFADCSTWYETIDDIHLESGLPQVQRNQFWEVCPLIAVNHCEPANVVLWPSQPFDLDDYNIDGSLKEGHTHKIDRYDPDGLFCVLLHHE